MTGSVADLQIPGYGDVAEIGRGGFAVVYRARRVAFAQDVAIKVLNGNAVDDNATARFERERQVLGALAQHPNIVTVYDSGTLADGSPFLVMEYLPGGPLSAQLKRQGPLDVRRVADIAVKLCGGLETAHRTGILHRDIKPDNILVSRYGEPVLADFGIARMRGALQTQTGMVTATLSHAPPEVLDGLPPTPRSDVYSLASTLFALLSGSAPFIRDTDVSITPLLARVIRDPVPDLRPRGVPGDVCSLIERAMAKDPADRPRSALEFGQAFQQLQRMNGATASPLVVEQLPGDVTMDGIDPSHVSGPLPPGPDVSGPRAPFGSGPLRPGPHVSGPQGQVSQPLGVPQPPGVSQPFRVSQPYPTGSGLPTARDYGPSGPTRAASPHVSGPQAPFGPPPFGSSPFEPPSGPGQPRRRKPWLWPTIVGAAAVLIIAAAVIIPKMSGGGTTADPRLAAGQTPQSPTPGSSLAVGPSTATPATPAGTGSGKPPVSDLTPLLLQFTDLGPGGGTLESPPDGDIAAVLYCSRTAPEDGKLSEAKRGLAPPSDKGYLAYSYVASFEPGAAQKFMDGLAQTAAKCADSSNLDEPKPISPPPGGESAVRVTATNLECIWVKYQDYVVKTQISFDTGKDVDDTTAPDIAAKAVAKVKKGVS